MGRRVFLCAGHELGGGAGANGLRENPYNALVGLLAVEPLRNQGVEAWLGPLSREPYPGEIHAKAAWVGSRARPDDLAVEIHLDINEPGCAAFAIERPHALALADTLAEHLSRATGLRCRGGMPERETGPGRLGFLHAVPCHAVLVELCSMNTSDAAFAKRPGARAAFARGLAAGCRAALDLIGADAQARVGGVSRGAS
jgi:N-acetylmuramoyl-L-alanine amidase